MLKSQYLLIFVVLSLPAKVFSAQTDIVLFGDSMVNGSNRLAYPLLEIIEATTQISGAGFCSFVDSSGTTDIGMVYLRSSVGWTDVDQSSAAVGLNISHLESDIVGAEINFSIQSDVDEVEIYFLKQPGGGSFRLYEENSGFVTLSTNSPYLGSDVSRIRWSPASLPRTFRLVLHEVGTAGVKLGGVNFKTDGPGVRIHKIGNGGLTAASAVSVDRDIWVESLRELDSEIFCILLGANDHIRNVSPTSYKAAILELMDRVKEATPDVEIVLMSPPDNAYDDRDYDLSDYCGALIDLCLEHDLRFLDFKGALGDYSQANAAGYYSDSVHPNSAGGRIMADAWYSLVKEASSGVVSIVNVLDESSVVENSKFSLLKVGGGNVALEWRRLPGVDYILCKSSDLENWEEVPVPAGHPKNSFSYELDDEVHNFFKLKLDYPNAW